MRIQMKHRVGLIAGLLAFAVPAAAFAGGYGYEGGGYGEGGYGAGGVGAGWLTFACGWRLRDGLTVALTVST